MTRTVEFIDTTVRDGNQSLWSATGLTAREILAIAPTLERVGFHALDFTSSTHMSVSVRFHREDPWELIRLMRAATPATLLSFITTGMRFIAWQPCDEDVMRLAFRCVVRNGIRRFQFAEPANDPEALRRAARIAREEGVEEIVVHAIGEHQHQAVRPGHTGQQLATGRRPERVVDVELERELDGLERDLEAAPVQDLNSSQSPNKLSPSTASAISPTSSSKTRELPRSRGAAAPFGTSTMGAPEPPAPGVSDDGAAALDDFSEAMPVGGATSSSGRMRSSPRSALTGRRMNASRGASIASR